MGRRLNGRLASGQAGAEGLSWRVRSELLFSMFCLLVMILLEKVFESHAVF